MAKKKYTKQISLGTDPVTGRRIRKRIYANSPTLLQMEEKRAVREFDQKASPESLTFDEYANRWFDTYCRNLSFSTTEGYRNARNKCDIFKAVKMQEITRTHLQTVINENWEKPYTCKKIKVFFTSMFRSAEIDGVVTKSPAYSLKIPRTPDKRKTERRAFTQEEIKAIQTAGFTAQERLYVDVVYQFGLRPGEAYALNYEDFDRDRLILTISKSLGHKGEAPFIKDTKTHVVRELPIPAEWIPKLGRKKRGLMFPNASGKLMTKNQADTFSERIIKKINYAMGGTDACKATDITMYSFRHNKASQLYYLPGISNKVKAKYMGHSEEIFVRTYSHLIVEKEDISVLSRMT